MKFPLMICFLAEAVLKSDALYKTEEAYVRVPQEYQPDMEDLERLKASVIGNILYQNEKCDVQMGDSQRGAMSMLCCVF